MRYLSVHDIVWLNSLVVGERASYDYERLENAMAAQYGYGDSRNVEVQAARFAEALAVARPFRVGNVRSALLATAVFLAANGYAVEPSGPEVRAALQDLAGGNLAGAALVGALCGVSGAVSGADMRLLITALRALLADDLRDASSMDAPVEPWTVSEHLHRS